MAYRKQNSTIIWFHQLFQTLPPNISETSWKYIIICSDDQWPYRSSNPNIIAIFQGFFSGWAAEKPQLLRSRNHNHITCCPAIDVPWCTVGQCIVMRYFMRCIPILIRISGCTMYGCIYGYCNIYQFIAVALKKHYFQDSLMCQGPKWSRNSHAPTKLRHVT